jgi:hypothetical protein
MKSFTQYSELNESFKKGDFIKTPTGEVHRVFNVVGNSLETAPYRGKNGYGGGTTVHKTKATKVPTPKDVTEEVMEEVSLDETTHVFHATVTRGRSSALGSTEVHHVKAKSREDAESKLHKDLAAHERKLHRLKYIGIKEEVSLDEMTQGKEYTQAQLQKKIQSGNWEATHDIKPGKSVEMRHHTGKRVTVHVKEEVSLDESVNQMDLYVAAVQKDVDSTKPHDQRTTQPQSAAAMGLMTEYVASIDKYVGSHLHNQGNKDDK